MSASRWINVAAYLRLSRTYRRAILNTWLYNWEHQVHGIVLDVGGEKYNPVRYTVKGDAAVQKWLYLNINPAVAPDIVADGANIPMMAASIDTVICLETLEHVDDPQQVMGEISRVLRPDGVLLLSIPFLYRVHSRPNDFWRFTEYQARRIVKSAGLEIVHMEYLGLLFTVLCDMIKQAISEIRLSGLRWLLGSLFLPVAALLVSLERLGLGKHSPALTSFTTGYLVLAVKTDKQQNTPDSRQSVEEHER